MYIKFLGIFVFIAIIILFAFHYRIFIHSTKGYEISQQEIENIKGYDLYNLHQPLIISFIEEDTLKYNIDTYSLYSPITIQQKYISLVSFDHKYISHNNEICLIRPIEDITVTLINTHNKNVFKKNKILDGGLIEYSPLENINKAKSIDIIVREYTILAIPRNWFFTFDKKDVNIEVFLSQNIFTTVFSIYK